MKTLRFAAVLQSVVALASAVWVLNLGAAQPSQIRIAGTLEDSTGKPIGGALVEGYVAAGPLDEMKPARHLTTGADGAFSFETAVAPTVIILGRKPGLAPTWAQYSNVTRDRTNEHLTLSAPAPVEGTVIDETGKPVAGALVRVTAAYLERQVGGIRAPGYLGNTLALSVFGNKLTSVDGRFRFDDFPAGTSADLAVTTSKALRPLERRYQGVDNMRCNSGQQDVLLVVEPAGSIEGKVVSEATGQPIPGASFRLQPNRPDPLAFREPDLAKSGPDGSFRLSRVAAGDYTLWTSFGTNNPPEWVAESFAVPVRTGETNKDVTITATRGGFLEVSVLRNEDRKPAAEVNLHIYKQNFSASARTDAGGTARLRLPPGEYRALAYLWDAQSEVTTAQVEANQTNPLELMLAPPPKVTGVVRDSTGATARGVEVTLHGPGVPNGNMAPCDADGRFELPWSPTRRNSSREFCLVASDATRNLAAVQTLDEGISNIVLRLQPGLTIEGSVQDPAGKPLANGMVNVHISFRDAGIQFDSEPAQTDGQGRFLVAGLPTDPICSLRVQAKGYGSTNLTIMPDSWGGRLALEPVVLRPANLSIAGQVLDADAKPVARTWVETFGAGQPSASERTDSQGRFNFQVCAGEVDVYAGLLGSSGSTNAHAGDTNLIIRFGQNRGIAQMIVANVIRPTTHQGKPLPALTGLSFAAEAAPAGKPLLLCLFDLEQRPSRRLAKQLADQNDALRQKGIVVLGVQATVIVADSLKELKDSAQLPFPVGNLGEKLEQTKWVSGVNSLPWLILTDATRTVIDEGFAIEDLEGKLKAIGK